MGCRLARIHYSFNFFAFIFIVVADWIYGDCMTKFSWNQCSVAYSPFLSKKFISMGSLHQKRIYTRF